MEQQRLWWRQSSGSGCGERAGVVASTPRATKREWIGRERCWMKIKGGRECRFAETGSRKVRGKRELQ